MTAEPTRATGRPMVLHVVVPQRKGAIGGSDLHVLDLARQQVRSGWLPLVLAPRAPNHYLELLRVAGVELIDQPLRRSRGLFQLPARRHVALVHAHGYEANYLVAVLRMVSLNWRCLPMVVTAHGWIEVGFWLRLKSSLDRLCSRPAQVRIATASAHVNRLPARRGKNVVVRNGVRPPRVRVNRVNSAGADVPDRHAAEVRRFVVGSVGRLSPEKRVDLFLLAARTVAATRPDVIFLVVGGGDRRCQLEALASELGLDDKVTFTGLVANVEPFYDAMDVLVQASDTEGTPRTVLEAMARRVPVVATKVGDVAELLDHGTAGVLTRPGNVEEMASAILGVLNDPSAAERIAVQAEARYRERYTVEAMEIQVRDCYEAAVHAANHMLTIKSEQEDGQR